MQAILDTVTYEDDCVAALHDSIETNIWQAEAYARHGEPGIARECLRSAWNEFMRFADVLRAYESSNHLRDRLMDALVRSGDASLAGIALCGGVEIWDMAAA